MSFAASAVVLASGGASLMATVVLAVDDVRHSRMSMPGRASAAKSMTLEADPERRVTPMADLAPSVPTATERPADDIATRTLALARTHATLQEARWTRAAAAPGREVARHLRGLASCVSSLQGRSEPEVAVRRDAAHLALSVLEDPSASIDAALAAAALVQLALPDALSDDDLLSALRRSSTTTNQIALIRCLATQARHNARFMVELRSLAIDAPTPDARAEALAACVGTPAELDGELVARALAALELTRSHSLARALSAAKAPLIDEALRRRFDACEDPPTLELLATVLHARGRDLELRQLASKGTEPWSGAVHRALARADVVGRAQ